MCKQIYTTLCEKLDQDWKYVNKIEQESKKKKKKKKMRNTDGRKPSAAMEAHFYYIKCAALPFPRW